MLFIKKQSHHGRSKDSPHLSQKLVFLEKVVKVMIAWSTKFHFLLKSKAELFSVLRDFTAAIPCLDHCRLLHLFHCFIHHSSESLCRQPSRRACLTVHLSMYSFLNA